MTNSLSITQNNDQLEETSELKIAQLFREHEEIEMIVPVALGLLVTNRFQLRGTSALLTNILIAGISRQIFKQLKELDLDLNEKGTKKTPSSPGSPVTQIAEGCSIIHSVPGRVRLRIQRLADDPLFAKRLQRLLNDDDYVISVRINRAASSLVVNYEANGLSSIDLGMNLLSIIKRAESEKVVTPSS